MKYNLILIDADDTLFDFKKSEENAFYELIDSYNLSINKEEGFKLYRERNKALWLEFEKGLISQKDIKYKRFDVFNIYNNINLCSKELGDTYLQILGEQLFLMDGCEEVLNYLSEKYKVIILTNGLSSVQRRRFSKTNFKELIFELVISEEVGFRKPEKEIFQHCMNIANEKDKDKVLIIGDSISSDILGGINFGIDTCYFNINKLNNNNTKAKYEITSLKELKTIL